VAGDRPPWFLGTVDISPPVLIHMNIGLVLPRNSSFNALCLFICNLFVPVVSDLLQICVWPIAARHSLHNHNTHSFIMRSSSTIIVLSALSMGVLGGVVPGPYYLNSSK
jgi:hypothetical protein